MMTQIRIDKVLSQMNIASRSECKKLFQSGRIRVNDSCVRSSSAKYDPQKDRLYVDDRQVIYQEYQYYMLYKPAGCVTATKDLHEKTVMDYLPQGIQRGLSPVGRLDKDTEGLLLITNDGALNHALLSPGRHVDKTYIAAIQGTVTEDTVRIFREGIEIGEKKPTAPALLEILNAGAVSEVAVTVTEGKFHQIKRMFQAVGMKVLFLKRISMGPLKLDAFLKPGECRELTQKEIQELKRSQGLEG